MTDAARKPTLSESESRRFGRSIGRLAVGPEDDPASVANALREAAHDLTFLAVDPQADLACLSRSIRLRFASADIEFGGVCRPREDPGLIELASWSAEMDDFVKQVFHGYRNHVAANPDLDATLVPAGYAEWTAHHLGTSHHSAVLVLEETDGTPVGFAAVEGTEDTITIDLAGIAPERRGRGNYQRLLDGVEIWARGQGLSEVSITTQFHNLAPQRAWARRGWLPTGSRLLFHVTGQDLID